MKRQFKGVWIPAHVMMDKTLTALDKILFADIDSFSSRDASFWKSNQTIAAECGVAQATVKRSIKKLIADGHIELVSFDGRTRRLRSLSNAPTLPSEDQTTDSAEYAPQTAHIAPQVNKPIKPPSTQVIFGDLDTQDFRLAWAQWKDYKKAEHRFRFKSKVTEQVAIKKLLDDTEGDQERAIEAIRNSIANGWKGIFVSSTKPSQRDRQSDSRSTSEWAGK